MDQALKARLIGAAVLVAVAVLLIPEILSGRRPAGSDSGVPSNSHGTRTFTIELGGGAPAPSTAPAPGSVTGNAPARTESMPPEPAQSAASVTASQEPPVAKPPAPAAIEPPPAHPVPGVAGSAPTPTPQPPAASSSAHGGWAVQVGAFSSVATAEKMVDQLKSAGYRAYVSPVSRSGKTLSRVRVGPEAERARAEGLATSLKARGLPAAVVANE